MKKCKLTTCKNKFKPFRKDTHKFCSGKCRNKYSNIHRYYGKYKFKSQFIKKEGNLRYCLGPLCLGIKKFRSLGAWNRICDKCKLQPEYQRENMIHVHY